MAKFLRYVETLAYFDGVQLFVGIDKVDTQYLCLLVERRISEEVYLCVPTSRARLKSFKIGEGDLSDFFSMPHMEECYQLVSSDIFDGEMLAESIELDKIPENWLPEKGFFLDANIRPDELIQVQAVENQRTVLHLSLNPPEARDTPKIDTENLVRILAVFQTFVKHAYKRTLSALERKTRQMLDDPKNYGLDVIGTSTGSFTVQLQSKTHTDLFGNSDLDKAFEIIDELVRDMKDEEQTLKVVRQYRGHLANVFIKLLEIVIDYDIPLFYHWTTPAFKEPRGGKIIRMEAVPVYKLLNSIKELGIEKVELIGNVIKADTKTGKWTLFSEENQKEYHGELSERSDMALEGIVMKSVRYRFKCEENIEEITGTGQEKKKLVLIRHETII